jgi:hypothetical protein
MIPDTLLQVRADLQQLSSGKQGEMLGGQK